MEDLHALQSTVIFRHESVLKARQPSELEASPLKGGRGVASPQERATARVGAENPTAF